MAAKHSSKGTSTEVASSSPQLAPAVAATNAEFAGKGIDPTVGLAEQDVRARVASEAAGQLDGIFRTLIRSAELIYSGDMQVEEAAPSILALSMRGQVLAEAIFGAMDEPTDRSNELRGIVGLCPEVVWLT